PAVAEEADARRVFELECKLELGLELVQLVEVGHETVILALPTRPGRARDRESPAREPAPQAARARTAVPPGVDAAPSGRARRWSGRRRAAGRGRSCAARSPGRPRRPR